MIIKVVVIGLVTAFSYVILKQLKPELAIFVALSGGLIIISLSLSSIGGVVNSVVEMFNSTGLNSSILTPIIKIVGIGYIVEFSANICTDIGASSIADKILFAGKIAIVVVAFPIISSMIEVIMGII